MSDRKPIVPHRGHLPIAGKGNALSHHDFNARLQMLRRETGIVEERVLRCCCATTNQEFTAHLRRPDEGGRFTIVKIVKVVAEAESGSSVHASAKPSNQCSGDYPASEFDLSGFICPWCSAEPRSVYCGDCNYFVCRGNVRPLPDGKEFFRCHDGCRGTGTIVPLTSIRAQSGTSRLAGRKRPALPRQTHKALPGKSAPRLNGGK